MPSTEKEAYGLKILTNNHPDIRRLRRQTGTPNIHGNKFWKSTLVLMDYLCEFPPPKAGKDKPLRVLEIGCGWGLAGIYCAKEFGAELTSLDADDSVFPYLEHHAALNGVKVTTWKCRYEKIRKVDLENFDVMIGADICFWDEMVAPLYNLTRRAAQAGVRVVMTDPGRPTFSAMASQCEAKLAALHEAWSVPPPYNTSGFVMDYDPMGQ
ncbi:class I SAM-dependent methyltransferase [Teredinibacter waterburyi]|jgi:Predicted methyltransferase|uniref:class I SAM-dependent methyltransferase n=1 Tax=Teredinibacter waterburyi TaxID=1500538 RepID=UPI00166004CE|nr:methyltransferase domain-containing protein [Teredinibacter waterburyi]